MSPEVYKQKLKSFFENLSRNDSEDLKLKKIDHFRRIRGIKKHLRTFVLMGLVFLSTLQFTLAQSATLIPTPEYDKDGMCAGLAEKFQSGNFELTDFPCYAMYLTELLVYIGGGIAVLFIVIGGYQYMIGGVTDDKDTGAKKTITHALMGLVVALLAWTIINVWQVWLTSGS